MSGLGYDLALFDFDGTLTMSDCFVPFLKFASSRLRWVTGYSLLAPVSVAYRLGALSPANARQCAALVAFAGREDAELHRLGAAFAQETIPKKLRHDAMDKLEWHKCRGDRVVIVSASLDFYLQPWCLDRQVELLCTSLSSVGRRSTGRFSGSDCSGEEKARRVRANFDVSEYSRVWAYGDTPEDFPLLRMAHEKCYRGRRVHSV